MAVGGLSNLPGSLSDSEVANVLVRFTDPETDLNEVMVTFLEDLFPGTPIEPGQLTLGAFPVFDGIADFSLFGYISESEMIP